MPLNSANIISPTGAGAGKVSQQSGRPATTQQNPWASTTKTQYLKNALTAGRNPTNAGSQFVPNRKSVVNPTAVANQFGQMNIQPRPNPNAMVFNPSMGPSPSDMSTSWRQQSAGSSQTGNSTFGRRIKNAVCKLSGMTKKNFRLGDVISLPFHTANSNPNVDPNTDDHWTQTVVGPAYSKRRMMVVMWKHERDMFCLPLYSFGGRGLEGKKDFLMHEYVSLKNFDDNNFLNQGRYPPVEIKCRNGRSMTKETTVWITGGMKVACNEDISPVGRLTRNSYNHLLELWQKLSENAQLEAYTD